MLYETTSGAASPIQVGGKTDSSMMMLAVMVILVIFVFIIFAIFAFRNERRDGIGGGMEALAPILATTVAANAGGGSYARDNYAFDLHAQGEARAEHLMQIRDTLIQSGELKQEIKDTQYMMTRDIDRNHYDALAVIKEDGEKTRALLVQQEREKLLAEVAYLRSRDLHHGFTGNKATVNVQDIGVGYGYGY